MENNSFTSRITGSSELNQPLNIGHDYLITVLANCDSIKKSNNEDGTFNFHHTLKQISADIVDDKGKVIKVKDKKSQSQKLRLQIMIGASEQGKDQEEEYNRIMTSLRHNLPEVLLLLDKLK